MAHEPAGQNLDQQERRGLESDIKHPQEQPDLPERVPQSLIEWLARINQRYLALDQKKSNDSS